MKLNKNTNLQKYLALLKTVEYKSFTKAAAELKCSQSGISRMIGDLEHEWGVNLLARSRAGVYLTAEGQKLLPYVRAVYQQCERLQTQVDELNGLQSGLIRIGTFSSVATHWLPNIIREFQKNYPNIEYEFLLGDYDARNWKLCCWPGISIWLLCRKVTPWRTVSVFRWQHWPIIPLCFSKAASVLMLRKFWRNTKFDPRCI